jgi:hypothetical protein
MHNQISSQQGNILMEATFEPSVSTIRTKMSSIEAIELSIIGALLWGLVLIVPSDTPTTISVAIGGLIVFEAAILGSWAIYLAYIRLTRGLYSRADVRLRIGIAALTGMYTLWAWIILDINRWILSKLAYIGEAPVEYAWSSKSKLARKEWEQAQKAKQVYLSM